MSPKNDKMTLRVLRVDIIKLNQFEKMIECPQQFNVAMAKAQKKRFEMMSGDEDRYINHEGLNGYFSEHKHSDFIETFAYFLQTFANNWRDFPLQSVVITATASHDITHPIYVWSCVL